jgi:hypothetical protein
METSRQGSWDNVERVAMSSGEKEIRQTTNGMAGVGTDDGSWWPCEFVGEGREA